MLAVDDNLYQRQDRPTRLLRQHVVFDLRQREDQQEYQKALEALAADLSGDHDASRGMVAA